MSFKHRLVKKTAIVRLCMQESGTNNPYVQWLTRHTHTLVYTQTHIPRVQDTQTGSVLPLAKPAELVTRNSSVNGENATFHTLFLHYYIRPPVERSSVLPLSFFANRPLIPKTIQRHRQKYISGWVLGVARKIYSDISLTPP